MIKIIKLNTLCIFSLLFFLSCKAPVYTAIDTPTIVSGTAKLTGTITIPKGANRDSIYVRISVPHEISGEFVIYKAVVDQSGKFSIDTDVETTVSFVHFSTSLNPRKPLLVKLKTGEVTHLDIAYNSNFEIENIDVTPGMNKNDMTQCFDLIGKMIEYSPGRKAEPLYNKSADYFLNDAKSQLSEILALVKNNTLISKELKGVLQDDFRLFFYKGAVFDYDNAMRANYSRSNGDKNKQPVIQKIDRSYHRFLKDLKLNDLQYLYAFTFFEFQRKLLQNEILAIPEIGENDIPSWLAKVKVILSDLVGFDNGPYYDNLAANAYGRQLNEEVRPLSEKQKENIANYWKNGEIARILLRNNQKIADLNKFKSATVVNDISSVRDDKVIETILAKYKGKVVLVDFWATWCGPCLNAMKEFRSTKTEFHDKDVVFVYLTNGSSPRKLWKETIKAIGSEHYYLTAAQWDYVMKNFGFQGIPSYLLYNKEGILVNKFTGFPGNDKLKAMINGLL